MTHAVQSTEMSCAGLKEQPDTSYQQNKSKHKIPPQNENKPLAIGLKNIYSRRRGILENQMEACDWLTWRSTVGAGLVAGHVVELSDDGAGQCLQAAVLAQRCVQGLLFTVLEHRHPAAHTETDTHTHRQTHTQTHMITTLKRE